MKHPLEEPEYRANALLVDPQIVDTIWCEAARYLDSALTHSVGDLTLDDLHEICTKRLGALLVFVDEEMSVTGAAVTQILDNKDGRRICRILAYGADDWNATKHCLEQVEEGARLAGVQAMHFNGRFGWIKLCEPMGYKVTQVIMEKTLTPAQGNA